MPFDLCKMSFKERQNIGNRVRGARIMAGLTQEDFAKKYDVSLSTLKNFEIARVIPRAKTVLQITEAIREEGIVIDETWMVRGGHQITRDSHPLEQKINTLVSKELEILEALFRDHKVNIITATVEKTVNEFISKGDIFLGVLQSKKEILEYKSIKKNLYLIEFSKEKFEPGYLFKEEKNIFALDLNQAKIKRIDKERLAFIIWHRRLFI